MVSLLSETSRTFRRSNSPILSPQRAWSSTISLSRAEGTVDHLIHRLPVKNLPWYLPGHAECLGEKGRMAGVFYGQATFLDDEAEERLYLGIAVHRSLFCVRSLMTLK